MNIKKPDGESCNNYFRQGKSFPDNVRDALCGSSGIMGATGPIGPVGVAGPPGAGVENTALVRDILEGVNGVAEDRDVPTYVDPYGWYHASNQYAPLVSTMSIKHQTFVPDALEHNIYDITYAGACVISEPINMKNGRTISLCLRQAGGGNHRISWDPIYHFDGGYGSLTLTDGAKDVVVCTKINDYIFTTIASDVKTPIPISY